MITRTWHILYPSCSWNILGGIFWLLEIRKNLSCLCFPLLLKVTLERYLETHRSPRAQFENLIKLSLLNFNVKSERGIVIVLPGLKLKPSITHFSTHPGSYQKPTFCYPYTRRKSLVALSIWSSIERNRPFFSINVEVIFTRWT